MDNAHDEHFTNDNLSERVREIEFGTEIDEDVESALADFIEDGKD